MHRRTFLHGLALAAPALMTAGRLYAVPASSPRFLLVFLRGGYDCANVVVPCSSRYYYEARPNIAIQKPVAGATEGAVVLDSDWALCPALRDSIAPLYASREALFIPFAGTSDLSRSHFETQDDIELGQPSQARRDLRSGFLSRLTTTLSGPASIAFTDSLPVVFRGATDIPNISLKGVGKPVFDERQSAILTDLYAGHHLQTEVTDGLALRQEVGRELQQEMQASARDAVSPKGFELEARRIGTLMRDQYRVGFVDVGGWDTHVNEGAVEGALANNIASLGRGLRAFQQELGPAWRDTVVVVVSEFGRTFRENGNRGTDHGHGSVYWVLGGDVKGGRIAGEQVRIERGTLFQDRDYPVLNDYRAVLGGLFASLWGLSGEQVQQVFPASRPVDLGLV
ncbi:MAG TPA: DUF1501 domain-containing protein [Steroidobacteraceae bacterium]|nr:DUF1501 domain-containing protein [Steroidobacteraceae bacterium]